MYKFKKRRFLIVAALSALMACSSSPSDKLTADEKSSNQATNESKPLDIKKISEALGNFIGRNLKAPGISFDTESIVRGIRDGAAGKPGPMSDQEYEKAMAELQQTALNALADNNLDAANKFMKDNASTKGIVELVPGKLSYIVLEEGKGPAVPEHGTPLITYTGTYIDGTVFGSSDNAGGPIAVPMDQTIAGFSKGLAGMKEGEKRRLFVHPELGYGRTGQLAPNSLLIFEVQVIKAEAPNDKKDITMADGEDDEAIDIDVSEGDEEVKPAAAKNNKAKAANNKTTKNK